MKRTAILFLAFALVLSAFGFTAPVTVSAQEPVYVNVTQLGGVTTGGWESSEGTGAYCFAHLPTSRLIDGIVEVESAAGWHDASAGFYYNVRTGYMYIDLGRAYKIHHIEVVGYSANRPMNCSGYDLVVSNNVPDQIPYNSENPNGELLVATPSYNSNALTLAEGVRSFDLPEDSGEYRYVSLEQFTDKGGTYGLTAQEVRVFVDQNDLPAWVNVAQNKPVDVVGIGGQWSIETDSNLVDGDEDTETGFYGNFGTKGYMYIDLGAEYKIDYIEILAYNQTYGERASGFDLVVSNEVPDDTPVASNSSKTLVANVSNDSSATSAEVGYKSFSLPAGEVGNSYRYVSLEKLYDNSVGLLVKEVKVYVVEEELPLHLGNVNAEYVNDVLTINADLTNSNNSNITFLLKAYDDNGMIKGIMAQEASLSNLVVSEPFTETINVAGLLQGNDYKVDLMAVDNLWEMNPVLYIEDVLSTSFNVLDIRSNSQTALSVAAQQKGMNAEITGSAPGNSVFATLLYPGVDTSTLTTNNIDDKIAYFGYKETDDISGDFAFEVIMPERTRSGQYSVVLGVAKDGFSIGERTETFNFSSIVDAFATVNAGNFIATADIFKVSFPELFTELNGRTDTIGDSFILTKAVFESGEVNEDVTALNNSVNIIEVMEASLLVDATINKTDFAAEITAYKNTMPLIFAEDFEITDEFVLYLNKVKTLDTPLISAENIVKAYKKSNALAILTGGTRDDAAKVISNYADVMGIDLSALTNAGVSVYEVAKKLPIRLTDIEGYITNGMGAAVTTAISRVLKDRTTTSNGGGGGGGGGGSKVTYPQPTVPTETKNPSSEKTEGNQNAESAETTIYTDIKGYDWAKDAISTLSEKEILGGVGNGRFAPEESLTREQAAKIIVLAFELESNMKTNGFDDCDIEEWYYPYVTAASANGIIKGTDRTTFGVGSNITRQDMAVMLDRALLARGLSSGSSANDLTDMDKVSEYAKKSVATLAAMGIITGMEDGSFRPDECITRAQAAVMISRILDLF